MPVLNVPVLPVHGSAVEQIKINAVRGYRHMPDTVEELLLIKGFHVTFKDGKVVEHGAEEGADLLGQLLDTDEGARSIGEVALVPASSPINRSGALFYSTLFDENAACHIAFGASYPGTTADGTRLSKEELLERGMNQSAIHEDVMIGAEDSEITGKCRDGRTVTLFQNGVWAL